MTEPRQTFEERMEANAARWFDAMKEKGHTPAVDESGLLMLFAYEAGYHNGPACKTCGWSCCWHCVGIEDIPECGPERCAAELAPSDRTA